MIRVTRLSCALVAVQMIVCSGCQCLHDEMNACKTGLRDRMESRRAWHAYRDCAPDDVWYPKDYGKGFRDGYRAVAEGGQGCAPSLPPQCYWGPHYQSECGQEQVQCWYHGYVYGANCASVDGVRERNMLLTGDRLFQRGQQASPSDVIYTDHSQNAWSNPMPGSPPLVPAQDPDEPYFPLDPISTDADSDGSGVQFLDASPLRAPRS